jgi:hypothetical protein
MPMAQIVKNGKVIWRNGSELDAMKDASQIAWRDIRSIVVVTTDRGRPLIQYGPNDAVKRINWR